MELRDFIKNMFEVLSYYGVWHFRRRYVNVIDSEATHQFSKVSSMLMLKTSYLFDKNFKLTFNVYNINIL